MLMPPKEIRTLQDAIWAMHGCESIYRKTVHVREVSYERAAWDGLVKIFKLIRHPIAKRCYAWSYREGQETKLVAVLEIPPVDSADSAARVALGSRLRER